MSGTEASFALSLISGVISIIDATKKVYDAAKDAKGQPEAFRQVAARLPLVIEILCSAKGRAPALEETVLEALEPTLESCKAKAESLKKIFHKVIRKDDDKWYDRYKKALSTLGKGDKVECLMEGILKDIQVLICERLKGTATEAQVKDIEVAIKDMKEMSASIPDEATGQTHSGSGDNIGLFGGTGSIIINKAAHDFHQNLHSISNKPTYKISYDQSGKDQSCLRDLRTTDPREDKKRIEDTKGGLLRDSYQWIFEHADFHNWRDNEEVRLLWITGDPGKGKTMLLCGIIDEMSACTLLSFFFCQATDSRINNATAVLQGLIYQLVVQQPSLLSIVRKKYDHAGKALFEDVNAWVALSEIFINILQDPGLNSTYLIIDALDKCEVVLDLIVQRSSISPRIKWVISSRNWPDIEERLERAGNKRRLCLELNPGSISQAHLASNANDTFLWVALVYEKLKNVPRWKTYEKLKKFPPGLDSLYQRMMSQICDSEDAVLLYRPITLTEIPSFFERLEYLAGDYESLAAIIGLCGSFLALRESTIYFIHQSAKDFLLNEVSHNVFPSNKEDVHYMVFRRSLQVMRKTLKQDVYSLRAPGTCIDEFEPPDPDPLAVVRYSCLYWVDHLLDCDTKRNTINDFKDGSSIFDLIKCLPDGILIIRKLENLQVNESPDLSAFIYDARRFAVYYRSVIEQAPLQLYCSALIFSPEQSIIRAAFKKCIPTWIQRKPQVQAYWSAALQTLEGHSGWVQSVAFSPDGLCHAKGAYDYSRRSVILMKRKLEEIYIQGAWRQYQ
ncbi:NACHT domain-containing protein [Amylocarpus encephaloides]|uniref:NACHT domain-containing protein n=1 Tax=Amylocarpus encephaloides TaxID=45428 RepID=A0A9P7YDW2_9HELO|nr:NACHT domain-containing protein [Amylocarpus encephaloides]